MQREINMLHVGVQDILLLGHFKQKEVKYDFQNAITLKRLLL